MEKQGRGSLLSFVTLGETSICLGDERVDQGLPAKAVAMLVYLADQGGRARRTSLAGLLWSDQTEERARANLRVALTRLRNEAGPIVEADREGIALAIDFTLDASQVEHGPAAAVSTFYAGEFLAEWDLAGAELFNEWVIARRADLRAVALHRLADVARRSRVSLDWEACAAQSRSILKIDPWNEQARRWMIEVLHASEGADSARAHYATFKEALHREIGVDPQPETIALVAGLADHPRVASSPVALPPHALPPRWPTRLLGREAEVRHLLKLVEPGRPVSIVGPGGMGKSRLLAEFARQRQTDDRVVAWIGFDGHAPSSSEAPDQAFAKSALVALGIPASAELGPMRSLIRHVGESEMTLCLDNLELLADVELPITELQHECPHLEIVLTSRRMPSLMHGRVLHLDGLPYNPAGADFSVAMQLFLDRTSRLDLSPNELERVADICAALEGHPLAIELAAHWTKTSPVSDLLGFLDPRSAEPTTLRTAAADLPARHRSLEAIVVASIAGVSTGAQRVLRGLSVFAGPFTRSDVMALLPELDAELEELVSHSLLSLEGDQYHVHPVIRRFARSNMDSVDTEADLVRLHAKRMVLVMETMENPIASGHRFQRRAADFGLAIDWMIDHAVPDELAGALARYLGFQRAWGWIDASKATVARALSRDDLPPVVRAELHRHAAEADLHAGDHGAAATQLEQGLELVGRSIPDGSWGRFRWNVGQVGALAIAPLRLSTDSTRVRAAERARLMSLLGEVLYVSERRSEMMSYGLGSLSAGRRSRDPVLRTAGDAAISVASQLAGAHRVSKRYRRRARSRTAQGYSNQFTASEAWGITSLVALGAGEWADARADCATAIAAASASGRSRMISQLEILAALVDYHEQRFDDALNGLAQTEVAIEQHGFRRAATWVDATRAEVLLACGDFDRAADSAATALLKARESGRPEDEARAQAALARCSLAEGDHTGALASFRESLIGLMSPSALAIQHYELHCGIAECAAELYRAGAVSATEANRSRSQLRAYSKAFPIARDRLKKLTQP